MLSSRILFHHLLFACFGLLICPAALAQIDTVNNSTSTPVPGAGHNYIGSLNETVDPGSGSVNVRIDVGVPSSRGITLPFSFAYDSNGVHFPKLNRYGTPAWGSNIDTLSQGGWSYAVPRLSSNSWTVDTFDDVHNTTVHCWYVTDFVFQGPSGGRHSLGLGWNQQATNACNGYGGGSTICDSLSGQEYPNGGDGPFSASLRVPTAGCPNPGSADVASADGTAFHFPITHCGSTASCSIHNSSVATYIEDRNGNQFSITYTASPSAYSAKDTLGRTQVSTSGFGATGNTVTVLGMSQPYTLTWGSAASNFTVSETPAPGPNVCQFPPQVTGTQTVITAITLPNGKQYQLGYDPTYGELSRITYPSGGYVSYVWGLNPQSAYLNFVGGTPGCSSGNYEDIYDKPAVLHRYVSFDGVNIALQQDFQYSTTWSSGPDGFGNWLWTSKQTTVTTYDCARNNFVCTSAPKSVNVYTYGYVHAQTQPFDDSGVDTQLQLEQTVAYKDANANTLRTITKGWFSPFTLACELQTLDNGQISGAFYTYGPDNVMTDKKEYDYGQITNPSVCQNFAAAPTGITPARETATTYQSFPNTPIYPDGPSIFDRPSSTITYRNGTRIAETDYS